MPKDTSFLCSVRTPSGGRKRREMRYERVGIRAYYCEIREAGGSLGCCDWWELE